MTLAYNALGTIAGKAEQNNTYIVATALDTTATVTGKPIANTDGQISYIGGQVTATNQTGTSPTLTLTLQGSDDASVWVDMKDSAGNTMATSALSISSASSTNVADFVDSVQKPRSMFPQYLRWKVVVGGSATPGGNYVVSTNIVRNAYRTSAV